MKAETVQLIRYRCPICKHLYDSEEEAESCASKPVSQGKGVRIGDKVRITMGDGKEHLAKVKTIYIIDKYWGHYQWEKYWHTVALTADIIDSWGTRTLTYDSYEPTIGRQK